jgi:hypothetical protein
LRPRLQGRFGSRNRDANGALFAAYPLHIPL